MWYNALKIYQAISKKINKRIESKIPEIIGKIKKNFSQLFWNEKGYLNDVILPSNQADEAIRPNQIYVVSLPFPLLNSVQEKSVVETVTHCLLTNSGLRSLQTDHVDFRATYAGNKWSRDTAYHQGTVWPFLLQDYYLAFLKVNKYSAMSKKEVAKHIKNLKKCISMKIVVLMVFPRFLMAPILFKERDVQIKHGQLPP